MGSPLFTFVTGMGCAASALIGAFLALDKDYFEMTQHAMLFYTHCGEVAATHSQGPGGFYFALLDALYRWSCGHETI